MTELTDLLKELRDRNRLSQQDVERDGGISRGYLSLIETGRRVPSEAILRKLASLYGVSPEVLLRAAGHIEERATDAEELERAYQFVLSDPKYRFGTRLVGEMTPEVKRFIVEMYEKSTGKKLL